MVSLAFVISIASHQPKNRVITHARAPSQEEWKKTSRVADQPGNSDKRVFRFNDDCGRIGFVTDHTSRMLCSRNPSVHDSKKNDGVKPKNDLWTLKF